MDAERDEDLLVMATASVGFLVIATCHEINRMFFGSAVSMVILQKVQNVNKTRK